eukprot:619578-Amphidinium_carterae.1
MQRPQQVEFNKKFVRLKSTRTCKSIRSLHVADQAIGRHPQGQARQWLHHKTWSIPMPGDTRAIQRLWGEPSWHLQNPTSLTVGCSFRANIKSTHKQCMASFLQDGCRVFGLHGRFPPR